MCVCACVATSFNVLVCLQIWHGFFRILPCALYGCCFDSGFPHCRGTKQFPSLLCWQTSDRSAFQNTYVSSEMWCKRLEVACISSQTQYQVEIREKLNKTACHSSHLENLPDLQALKWHQGMINQQEWLWSDLGAHIMCVLSHRVCQSSAVARTWIKFDVHCKVHAKFMHKCSVFLAISCNYGIKGTSFVLLFSRKGLFRCWRYD